MTAVTWTAAARPQPLWRLMAACRTEDPDLFVGPLDEPEDDRSAREAAAKAICARCPVQSACLSFALDTGQQDGVWAGCNAAELLRARRNRWKNGRRLRARERKAAA